MASGDIYLLSQFQSWSGEQNRVLNTYFYRQQSPEGDAADVIAAFQDSILPELLGIQTNNVRTTRFECFNLFNVTDFSNFAYAPSATDNTGLYVDQALPAHDAVTYRLVRTTREIRNGYKRFAGIPETANTSGNITDATYITALEALRIVLSEDIQASPVVGTYSLVVVKRIKYVEDGKTKYRLPITQAEAEYSEPSQVLVSLQVRTQNTRKG